MNARRPHSIVSERATQIPSGGKGGRLADNLLLQLVHYCYCCSDTTPWSRGEKYGSAIKDICLPCYQQHNIDKYHIFFPLKRTKQNNTSIFRIALTIFFQNLFRLILNPICLFFMSFQDLLQSILHYYLPGRVMIALYFIRLYPLYTTTNPFYYRHYYCLILFNIYHCLRTHAALIK